MIDSNPIYVDLSHSANVQQNENQDLMFPEEHNIVFNPVDVMTALKDLEVAKDLCTIRIKNWIIFVRNDFDLYINQEPQQAISLFLHLDTGQYLIRVWSQTIKVGLLRDLKGILYKLHETFHDTLPCTGFAIADENITDGINSHTPYLRSHSNSCQHIIKKVMRKGEFVLLCEPCQVLKGISETYDDYHGDMDDVDISEEDIQEKADVKCEVEIKEEIHSEEFSSQQKKDKNEAIAEITGKAGEKDIHEDEKNLDKLESHEKKGSNQCTECGKFFSSGYHLTQHQRKIHLISRYDCPSCTSKYKDSEIFYRHVVEEHPDLDKLPCRFCRNDIIINEWLDHIKLCVKTKKPNLKSKLPKRAPRGPAKGNGKKIKKGTKKIIKCKECGQEFSNQTAKFNHVRTVHRGLLTYVCEVCEESFKSWHQKRAHSVSVHEYGKFWCPEEDCNTKLDLVPKLLNHLKENHPQRTTTDCDSCNVQIALDDFSKHRLNCTLEKEKAKRRANRERHLNKGIKCRFCDEVFKCFFKRTKHENEIHTGNILKCEQCDFQTQDAVKFYSHRKQKHERVMVTCEICGLMMTSDSIRSHRKYVHENKKDNAQCPDCGEIFERNQKLKIHRILVHGMEDKSKRTCPTCGKILFSLSAMELHMVYHKAGTFSCEVCGRNVKTQKALNNHMKTHTGEKAFK